MSLASSLCLWEPWVSPRSRSMGSCSASTWQTLLTFSSSHLTSATGVGIKIIKALHSFYHFKRYSVCDVTITICVLSHQFKNALKFDYLYWCPFMSLSFYEGQRFRYTYYDESQGEIYRSIEHLDKMVTAEMYLIRMWRLVTRFCHQQM